MGRKVEKCTWDRYSCCSELARGASGEVGTVWLAGGEAGRGSRELGFVEKFPWSGLLTEVNFGSAACSVPQEVVRQHPNTHKAFSYLKPTECHSFLCSLFEVTKSL